MKTAGFKLDPTTGQFTAMSGVSVTLGLPIIHHVRRPRHGLRDRRLRTRQPGKHGQAIRLAAVLARGAWRRPTRDERLLLSPPRQHAPPAPP